MVKHCIAIVIRGKCAASTGKGSNPEIPWLQDVE
jgi:hypothetical protein